jgi:hypothetical protein
MSRARSGLELCERMHLNRVLRQLQGKPHPLTGTAVYRTLPRPVHGGEPLCIESTEGLAPDSLGLRCVCTGQ